MNMLLIFEIVLLLACIFSLAMMRRSYFPVNLFWAVGVTAIGAAAALGAFVYAGFDSVAPYHTTVTRFAGSVGLVSLALAAAGGIFSRQFHQAGWWIVLIGIMALVGVLLFDAWQLSENVRYGVIGVLVLAAVYRLLSAFSIGIFLAAGTAFLVIAGTAAGSVASMVGMNSTNLYHLLLSVAVLLFGIYAMKE
ncbi:hypothetical protein [Sneathiella chinensis]|uniref:DUF4203 domain-containing protein n=1 Tax=Sneathiella chinensis TaxID=349750 RepID=A0ABQ5U1R1_9PROT|nr:hypothetical protein [Sneathiella chinensis]GLQ05361.1 hypothetical protein GCM10007924_05820 [Sneathiella chinensis]